MTLATNDLTPPPALKSSTFPLTVLGIEPRKDFDTHVSAIKTYRVCPRKWLFEEMYGLHLKGEYHGASKRGNYYHTIMRALAMGEPTEMAVDRASQEAEAIRFELAEMKDDRGLLPNGKSFSFVEKTIEDNLAESTVMALWAHEYAPWPGPPFADEQDWEIIGVEQPIRAYWPQTKDWTRCTLDLVRRHKKTREIWVIDHKTTQEDPTEFCSPLANSLQARLYTAVAREAYKDHGDVAGFCFNVQGTILIRQKRNQTFEDYLEEVGEWYSGRGRHSEKADTRFKNPMFRREWARQPRALSGELLYLLGEMKVAKSRVPSLDIFPRNEDSCFYKRVKCRYMPLCFEDPANWGSTLESRFHQTKHRESTDQNIIEVEMKI